MKICILSMQDVNNFGSLLQAYALKKILKTKGNVVDFIHIEKRNEESSVLKIPQYSFQNEDTSSKLFRDRLKKIDKYFFNRISNKIKNKEEEAILDAFRREYIYDTKIDENERYDLCVIGSDEVFNCTQPSSWGFSSQLFGNVDNANNIITYAASCGSTSYDMLNNEARNIIKRAFKRIYKFSVRDENTFKFVYKLTGRNDITINLDPVLITDFSKETNKNKLKLKLPEHYCLVYAYTNRIHDHLEIKQISDFCSAKGLTIITVGMGQPWIPTMYALNPFELLNVVRQADFVITDTFHGTIFCAKYASKFAVITRKSNYYKLNDLITRIGVEDHLMKDFSELERIYCITNDFNKINKKIEEAYSQTIMYFENVFDEL